MSPMNRIKTIAQETLPLFFLLVFGTVYSQQWHFTGMNKSAPFEYEYQFQFDHKEDTSSYHLERRRGHFKSTVQLKNNKEEAVMASIRIHCLDNDSMLYLLTDLNGFGALGLIEGKYKLEIAVMGYDRFVLDFEIPEKESCHLEIQLGLGPELTVYQIKSKLKLDENEIAPIMKCVQENRTDFYKKCINNEKYILTIQI